MRATRWSGGIVVLLAMASCTRESDAELPLARAGARELVVEPMVPLHDDDGYGLARPEWISETPGGALVVTDLSDKNLKLYASDGRRTGTVGRAGHGPGEFAGLTTAQAYGDSLMAYDLTGSRITIFGPDGRYARALAVSRRTWPMPFSVRVVDDSLFLLVAAVAGAARGELLGIIRPDGSTVASFFNASSYLGTDPRVVRRTGLVADAAGGYVFAALVGGDSVWVFDYRGRRVGAQGVDPVQPLVSTRALFARARGRERGADGRSFTHGNRNVIGLVALDSGTVALQVAAYDAEHGTDPLEGGTFILAAARPEGVRILARRDLPGALLGRDRRGRGLLLRYASADMNAYELMRLRAASAEATP